jgi:hypothetical protein
MNLSGAFAFRKIPVPMLTVPLKRQKPCRAAGFQNAEQGLAKNARVNNA